MKKLEEKIMAFIHGELNDNEAKEILELIDSDPNAALLYQELLEISGLVKKATEPEEDWKMDEERRAHLLAILSGESLVAQEPILQPEQNTATEEREKSSLKWGQLTGIAACVAATLVVVGEVFEISIIGRTRDIIAYQEVKSMEPLANEVVELEQLSIKHEVSKKPSSPNSSAVSVLVPKPSEVFIPELMPDGIMKGNLGLDFGETEGFGDGFGTREEKGFAGERLHGYSNEGKNKQYKYAEEIEDTNNRPNLKSLETQEGFLDGDKAIIRGEIDFFLNKPTSDNRGGRRFVREDLEVDLDGLKLADILPEMDNETLKGRKIAKSQEVKKNTKFDSSISGKYQVDEARKEPKKVLKLNPEEGRQVTTEEDVADVEKMRSHLSAYDESRSRRLAEVDKAWEIIPAPAQETGLAAKREKTALPILPRESKLEKNEENSEPTREIKNLNDENSAQQQPFSTFSLHVSDVSFKLAEKEMLENGKFPDRNKIRPEEFLNAFDYGDPSVRKDQKVACEMEQARHPFMQQRNLMRVSMSTAALGRSQPLRLTLLLDNSGSMERSDREACVIKAMEVLVSQLQPQDEVSLISFAQQPRIIAEGLKGAQLSQLIKLVKQAPSEGGTNMERALRLAGQVSKRHQEEGRMSRIVLMTDGAANLGNAEPEDLSKMVVELRQQGIAFDACGVGADKLDDSVLEALARKGDGRYYLLDKPEDADDSFVKQLAGALRPAASNVKVQVRFNPKRVKNYKLLGFEKHLLRKEDFRDDSVDAAEMSAQEAGSAMYQFEPIADGEGEVGEVSVRFKDMNTNQMVERSWSIPYLPQPENIKQAAPSMQLATTAAMLAEKIRETDVGLVDFSDYGSVLGSIDAHFGENKRVQSLIKMVRKASNH